MKSKKSLCIILAAAVLALSFSACGGKSNVENTATKVDSQGNAYIEMNDKDGNIVTSVLSEKDKSKADKINKDKDKDKDKDDKTTTVKPSRPGSADPMQDLNASKDDLLAEGEEVKKTTLRDDVIGEALKTKSFTLATSIVSNGTRLPATIYMDRNRLGVDLTYDMGTGAPTGVRMLIMDDMAYMILIDSKTYFELPGEGFEGFGQFDEIDSDQTFVKSTEVKEKGRILICEEYKNEAGAKVKYYFDGRKWVRWELIEGDTISVFEVSKFKAGVDSKIFNLGSYKKVDLNAMAGGQLGM